jgi:hypothetical protein
MQDLILTFSDRLLFRIEGLTPGAHKYAQRFFNFHHRIMDDASRNRELTIAPGSRERKVDDSLKPVFSQPPLRISQSDSLTVYEIPGAVAWYDENYNLAQYSIHSSEELAVEYLIRWVLVALMFHLALDKGWIGCHAAAVSFQGRAIVLPGPSESGKTTIFKTAHSKGYGVISDDLLWIRQGQQRFHAHAFVRNESGIEVVPQPTADDVPIEAVVLPSITPLESSRLEDCNSADAIQEVASQMLWFGGPRCQAARFQALARLLATCRTLRLAAGSNREDVPDLLQSIVDPGFIRHVTKTQ